MANFGSFSGNPLVRWLTESGDDRRMRIEEDFWYLDPDGKRWDAPRGSEIDGASIPKIFWARF